MAGPDRALRTLVLVALTLMTGAWRARADFPSLSRPWAFGTPAADRAPGMRLSADASIAEMSRSDTSGTSDPRLSSLEPGGRFRLSLARGPLDASAEVILDTRWNVDSREYPQRFSLGYVTRAASARAAVGFESGVYDGFDLELESASLPLTRIGGSYGQSLVAWTRLRRLEFRDDWLFTPALGIATGALARDAPGLGVMLSAQMDAAHDEHSSGFGMIALRWTAGGDAPPPPSSSPLGTPGWEVLSTRWFAHAAYAFPLEREQYARITFALGVGFASPF